MSLNLLARRSVYLGGKNFSAGDVIDVPVDGNTLQKMLRIGRVTFAWGTDALNKKDLPDTDSPLETEEAALDEEAPEEDAPEEEETPEEKPKPKRKAPVKKKTASPKRKSTAKRKTSK